MMPRDPAPESISVILPALNEAGGIARVVARAAEGAHEVIVADGGSDDATVEVARGAGARVLRSAPGRALQMNAGARAASGDILLFLHADTLLPPGYDRVVRRTLRLPSAAAGAFSLGMDVDTPGLRWVAAWANWRSRILGWPYGDQGLFLRREVFFRVGPYPETPILEDVGLVRRLRRKGRVVTAAPAVATSARRWLRLGVLRTTATNQLILVAGLLGASPDTLSRWYRKVR